MCSRLCFVIFNLMDYFSCLFLCSIFLPLKKNFLLGFQLVIHPRHKNLTICSSFGCFNPDTSLLCFSQETLLTISPIVLIEVIAQSDSWFLCGGGSKQSFNNKLSELMVGKLATFLIKNTSSYVLLWQHNVECSTKEVS